MLDGDRAAGVTDPDLDPLPGTRNTEPLGDLGDRDPSLHVQHGAIPLLRHANLHQHSAECYGSSEANV